MKILLTIVMLLSAYVSGCTQSAKRGNSIEKVVAGGCEGCEAVYEFGNKKLTSVDTLPDFHQAGPKLQISGTIYKRDGKTPAKDVILYVYHTDQKGIYPTKGNETGWDKRHGYIRGWIKTNADGKYTFYTLKPTAYPGREFAAHIHPVIKEPGFKEYWIDEFLFDDDPLLTQKERSAQPGRGGKNGILKTSTDKNGMLVAKRDIVLGLNVPGYE